MRALLIATLLAARALAAQELITNGTFQSGSTGWQLNGAFYADDQFENYHDSPGYAYLSNADGTPGNNLNGTLKQTFTIPASITSATLRFWYSITTTDSPTTPFDVVSVSLQPSNTFLTAFSNTNAGGYRQKTFDLTSFAGQTVTLQFFGTTDASYPTVFRIDDVSATYVSAPTRPATPTDLQAIGDSSTIYLTWQDNANNETAYEVLRGTSDLFLWTTLPANYDAAQDSQPYGTITCYRVRATNSAGPSDLSNQACATSLDNPTLLQPADGTSTSATSISLSWQPTPLANRYRLEVGTSCSTTDVLIHDLPETSYTMSVTPGTYYWRVLAANTTNPGRSARSQCRTFTITAASCMYTFNEYNFTLPANGGSGTIILTASDQTCQWSATKPSDGNWLTIESGTGTGNGTITFSAPANPSSTNQRGTTITVGNATAGITQPPSTPSAPVTNFTFTPSTPTLGQQVAFTDTSTGNPTTWSWNFDDGGTSTLQHPTHAFSAPGTYTVSLTASNTGGSSNAAKTITVSATPQAPDADFTYTPGSPLVHQAVSFTDTSTNAPTTWSWNFDDGSTSTQRHPSHTFTSAGTYAVTLTATNPQGSSAKTRNITVSTTPPAPVADFTFSPTTPSAGSPLSFTDTTSGTPTTWSWDFESNGTIDSTQQHPTHTYTSPGTYNAKLTATNAQGTSTKTKTITVTASQAPGASFTYAPTNPTPGQPVAFTDTSTNAPTTWTWNFDDGGTSTLKNPIHAFATPGTYKVQLSAANTHGSSTVTKNVSVAAAIQPPKASFTTSTATAPINTTIRFTDTSAGSPTSWRWEFGDGEGATTATATHSYKAEGVYHVKLTVANAAGQDSATRDITVTSPTVTIRGNVKIRHSAARIRGGSGHPRAVRLFDRNGNPTSYVQQLTREGTYSITAPTGTYSAVCSIEYDNDITAPSHPRTRSATARRNGCNGNTACDIEFGLPIVFLHGLRPPFDAGEQRWTLWRNSVPSDVITFAPHYGTFDSIEEAATLVTEILSERFELFTETPRFNIIAHSKGGLVARVLRSTSYKDDIQTAVLLGTPNDGSNCFSFLLSLPAGLSWCDLQTFNGLYPRFEGDVFVIAGTSASLLHPCPFESGPSDSIVPVDSVFKITRLEGFSPTAQVLPGIVVPQRHGELGTKGTWLLTEVILPYFNRTKPLPDCPRSYITRFSGCSIGALRPVSSLCLAGRGLNAGRTCSIPPPNEAAHGVALSWQPPSVSGGAPGDVQTTIGFFDPCAGTASMHNASASTVPSLQGYYVLRSSTPITAADVTLRVGFTLASETTFVDPLPLAGVNYYAIVAEYEGATSIPAVAVPVDFPIRRRAVRK